MLFCGFHWALKRQVTPLPLACFGSTFPFEKTPRFVHGLLGTTAGAKPMALTSSPLATAWPSVSPLLRKQATTPVCELPPALNGFSVKSPAGLRPKPKNPTRLLSYLNRRAPPVSVTFGTTSQLASP